MHALAYECAVPTYDACFSTTYDPYTGMKSGTAR